MSTLVKVKKTDIGSTGGRTAWSSTVTIAGATVLARYWYDGNHANNAKEDAAEVALIQLSAIDASSNQVGYKETEESIINRQD